MHFDAGSIVEGVIAEMAILDGHAMVFQDVEIETKVSPLPRLGCGNGRTYDRHQEGSHSQMSIRAAVPL